MLSYVPFETLEAPRPDGQIYTCLEPARRYLYQAAEPPVLCGTGHPTPTVWVTDLSRPVRTRDLTPSPPRLET